MARPIATTAAGICFAFPDVMLTPTSGGPVPVPYPNLAQQSSAQSTSDGSVGTGPVKVRGKPVLLASSEIPTSTGGEAGSAGGGVTNGQYPPGTCWFPQGSISVQIHNHAVQRVGDPTEQNATAEGAPGNAKGTILGGEPTVAIGG